MPPLPSYALVATFLVGSAVSQGPVGEQLVSLAVVAVDSASFNYGIEFATKTNGPICVQGAPGEGRGPDGILIRAEAADSPQLYKLTVDTDRDGKLEGEPTIQVGKDLPAQYMLRGKFPFRVRFNEDSGKESLSVFAAYRGEGRIRVGTKDLLVVVQDLQFDGDLDAGDLRQGSALGIDTDADGRIWGAHELFSAGQVMALGNEHWLVDVPRFTAERLELRFVETTLPILDVGQAVPSFTMRTLSGREVTPASLRGKPFVLDFWASWCAPCVAKLPAVRELAERHGTLEVFYVSVDNASGVEAARAAADKQSLPHDRVVALGLADQDPAWQLFGSMRVVRMRVPAYVLVDGTGVIRYAGNGGDKLAKLEAAVSQVPQ
jgi:thiol-disulfide isomerase/thioredoxin